MLKRFIGDSRRWVNCRQPCLLEPLQQLVEGDSYDWRSTGDDPAFKLKPSSGPMPRGWYMLELRVRASLSRFNGKLYFSYGDGFDESLSYKLPLVSGKLIKKVVYFPRIATSLRFDPCEEAAEFSVEQFQLCKLSAGKARSLMIDKVSRTHPDFKLEAGSLKPEALLAAYSECFCSAPLTGTYEQWIGRIEQPLFGDHGALRVSAGQFERQPLISVLMPVYNPPELFLRAALDSVLAQAYSHWELCIADDCSTEPYVRRVLEEYQARDSRIKVVFREKNGHISQASNSALALATGEYTALFDHDDCLAPHALYCVTEAINQNPDAQLFYSDEDFIDEDGHRQSPHFKSQWNPELLYSHNYITHLAIIQTALLKQVDGFREGYEGAQDYDLMLRLTQQLKPDQIHHIPHVLYHWRAFEGSTASSADAKGYATEAGLRALQDAVRDQPGVEVVHDKIANFYRVKYPLPEQPPLVSVIIPTRNGLDVIKPCIESILSKTRYQNYEILIVDNQSDDPETLAWLDAMSKKPEIRLLHFNQPFNYSAINNFAAEQAQGEFLALVNNDVEVITPDWLNELVSLAIKDEIGCVGAKLYYPDGDIQHAGVILGLGGYAAHAHRGLPGDHPGYFNRANARQNLSAVTGACLVVRKSVYQQAGGLEEAFTVAYNDVDFCLKVQAAGYRNVFTPYAELYHFESKTRGFDDTPEKQARFEREKQLLAQRWQALLDNDPYYSPNLTRSREDFSVLS